MSVVSRPWRRRFRQPSALQVFFFTGAVYILFTPSGKSRPLAVLARVSGFSLSESLLTDKLSFSPLPSWYLTLFLHLSPTFSVDQGVPTRKGKRQTLKWVVWLSCSLEDWEETDRQSPTHTGGAFVTLSEAVQNHAKHHANISQMWLCCEIFTFWAYTSSVPWRKLFKSAMHGVDAYYFQNLF